MWILLVALLAPVSFAQDDDPRRTPTVVAIEAAAPAVVTISTTRPVNNPWARFTGQQSAASEGSGVIIDADGVVLTNAHVVQGAHTIEATFPDGRHFPATILGLDPDLDLAVLRLKGRDYPAPVAIGSSDHLLLGEPVIALGNPLGLGHTVTTGVVSAVHRRLQTSQRVFQDYIQTDASINPGNSGGPLIDITGRLIGINTAIRADGQNIGFAIPVDRAMKVARDLLDFGQVRVPWLGCDLTDIGFRQGGGAAQVSRVWADSPATRAGLRPGDLIVAIDDRAIQGRGDLNTYLAAIDPSVAVHLTLRRDNAERQVTLRGGTVPANVVDRVLREILGITLNPTGAATVTGVTADGGFRRAGMQAGDRILAVNGLAVGSASDFRDAITQAKAQHRDTALVTIARGRATGNITLPI